MTELSIIQINDVHGYLKSHNELFYGPNGLYTEVVGGYSRIKTLIDTAKEKNSNTIVLDCGDTFHGTFITTQTKGDSMIPLLNKMGIDAMTAHWDFAYTPSKLRDLAYKLNFPLLASNVYLYDKSNRVFDPYIIKNINGMRVGIFGMACEHIVQGFGHNFSKGIYMSPEYEEVPRIVKQLKNKENCDFIIMLSHLGMPTDYEILSGLNGVDVCISGHTHNRLENPILVGNTILIQSGCHGSFVGELILNIENKKIISFNHKLIKVDKEIRENIEIEKVISEIYKPYNSYLKEIVGKTNTLLCRDMSLNSTMDNFLLNAISYVSSREICFSHGWRYGAPIPIGNVTLEDLFNITPMNPYIINVDLIGYEIKEMLEGFIENTYSRNPFGQVGGYMPRALGIKAYVKIENPKGHRIQKIFIKNCLLDLKKIYKASYITSQGVPKYLGENREKLNIKAVDAMRKYLEEVGPFNYNKEEETFVLI